MTKMHLGLIVF